MTDLDRTLEQARNNAVGYGNKRGLKDTAEDYLKGVYAMLYPDAPSDLKTVPERDAWVRRQKDYTEAIDEKKKRYAEWTAAELYMKILFTEAEVWRTRCANDRLMDKAHK